MNSDSHTRFAGIASLFESKEIKRFFKNYLFTICLLETLIFFISLFCLLEPFSMNFPWRYYLLASFLTPVVMTFLLGLVVKAFNVFFIESGSESQTNSEADNQSTQQGGTFAKLNSSLSFLRQAPFLLSLLFLIVGAVIFSQIDHIFAVIGTVGEKAVVYALITLGVLFLVFTIFAFVWLILKFKLEKVKYQTDHKREVMLQLGMFLTDDDRLINHDGQIISLENKKQIHNIEVNPRPAVESQKQAAL
jgi:predicted tellurium resistance membrane protein TerC